MRVTILKKRISKGSWKEAAEVVLIPAMWQWMKLTGASLSTRSEWFWHPARGQGGCCPCLGALLPYLHLALKRRRCVFCIPAHPAGHLFSLPVLSTDVLSTLQTVLWPAKIDIWIVSWCLQRRVSSVGCSTGRTIRIKLHPSVDTAWQSPCQAPVPSLSSNLWQWGPGT